jgi:membrane protease YdiL (CAAX protease family)
MTHLIQDMSWHVTHDTVRPRVNWRQIGLFLGLTFALTWLLDLAMWLTGGYGSPGTLIALNLQMLIPAFSATVLGLFVFRDHPIHIRSQAGKPRWFFYFFLAYTLAYTALAVVALVSPAQAGLLNRVGIGLALPGLILLLVLRLTAGREAMARVGLAGGKWTYWLLGGAGLILFYSAQMGLNALFGLGQPADAAAIAAQAGMPAAAFLAIVTAQTLLMSPFLGLITVWGEEYGWRGYLQDALNGLGRVKGTLVLGLIWGLWHAPVVAMGHNFPNHPLLGIALMTIYSTLLAYVLAYAVLKSGNTLLAAFLHQLNNGFGAYLTTFWYKPDDFAFSFFAGGLYGLPLLLIVVLLILRDPVWKARQ